MLLRRALPAARQSLAHSFPFYEMGSNANWQNRLIEPARGLGVRSKVERVVLDALVPQPWDGLAAFA
jgi:hypothetical protein